MGPSTSNDNWPLQDFQEVGRKLKRIAEHSKTLLEFEAAFVKNMLRMAYRFKSKLRLSPKQVQILDELYAKHVLPIIIDVKVATGSDAAVDEGADETSRPRPGPEEDEEDEEPPF